MDRRRNRRDGFDGRLPEKAPLANPYVPFQLENPPRYEAPTALIRGTAFPGLDLPFKGMVNRNPKKSTPLSDMQVLAFMIQELALYLDTHRDDQEALELYRAYQEAYDQCKRSYTMKSRPLNHMMPGKGPYSWLDDPWPWEYAANKEG